MDDHHLHPVCSCSSNQNSLGSLLLTVDGHVQPTRHVDHSAELAGRESTGQTELGLDALHSVGGVDVLDQDDLVAGGSALAGSNGGVGKEEFPDLSQLISTSHFIRVCTTYPEPSRAVLGLHLLAIAHPVSVPSPEGGRVVYTDSVNALDLEPRSLQLVDKEAKRGGCIGAGEDVFVHEETPDEILILPWLSQTRNLQKENSIVVKHVVNLSQEGSEVTDTNVLGHL